MTDSARRISMPTCPTCGQATGWTGTFRFQTERIWEVQPGESKPVLLGEDDDYGEWAEIHCSGCHAPAEGSMESEVIQALLGG